MRHLCLVLVVWFLLAATAPVLAAPQAICVQWQASEGRAHPTYSGALITLKGIARGGATEFRWEYGDGGSTAWAPITDPYNLGVKHSYAGLAGTKFAATLHVRDAVQETTDTYPIKIHLSADLSVPAELDVRRDMAMDEGLWYLHTRLARGSYGSGAPGYGQPYGYWQDSYYGYPVAATGTSVDAFQVNGHKLIGDNDGDPYVETVQRATNYLLMNTYSYSIGLQPAGNPDTNGNGIGLVTNQSSSLYDSRQTYIGGICATALASSGSPNYPAPVGGSNVRGRPIKDIVQDMVDFFAWGQNDPSSGIYNRGGWRYFANFGSSDMSTAQWPPLAMLIARDKMGSMVPAFVGTELALYLDAMQSNHLDNDNGNFGYSGVDQMVNITKTAAGIICWEFIYLTPSTPGLTPAEAKAESDAKQAAMLANPRVQKALGFIYRHWNDGGTSWDYTKLHGNSYGMYGVMKAFRNPNPDVMQVTEYNYNAGNQTGNSFNWYYTPAGQAKQGLATYIVGTQQADGSWDDTPGPNPVYDAFCTGWRILTLAWVTIPPQAVICRPELQDYNWNQDIHVDGSCSYHPDPDRQIARYEWDWDYNGTFVADAQGVQATKVGGYPSTGLYPVALRVTDDSGQTDIAICSISVHPPPHCPQPWAFPVQGGHYIGWINVPVTLDASKSSDPNNDPLIYEWELDWDDPANDPKFDDATGVNPSWTWTSDGVFPIGLRVTDVPDPTLESCSQTDFSTIEIGNHAPVADPNGPYCKAKSDPNPCLTLDGSASSDPDVGDAITFAWDTNADGIYDDGDQPTCQFCIDPSAAIGTVYDVRLKVTDSLGKYDIGSTTVTICPNRPPVAVDDKVATPVGVPIDVNVLKNDYDADGDALSVVGTTQGAHGKVSVNPVGTVHYTPAPGFSGIDTFTYTVRDGKGGLDTGTVEVTVKCFVLTSPNGGESFLVGTVQPIAWKYGAGGCNIGPSVGIELLQSGMVVREVVFAHALVGAGGVGMFQWTVPTNLPNGNYQIRARSVRTPSINDTSDSTFAVTGAGEFSMALTTPNAPNTVCTRGKKLPITWTYKGTPYSTVRIDLLRNGFFVRNIAQNCSIGANGQGNYDWLVPSIITPGINYKVQITLTSRPGFNDVSDSPFRVL